MASLQYFFQSLKDQPSVEELLSWFKCPFLHLLACLLDGYSHCPHSSLPRSPAGHSQSGRRPMPDLARYCITPGAALPTCLKPGSQTTAPQKVRVLWCQLLASAGYAFFEAFLPSSVHNLNQCIVFRSLQASPIHLLLTDLQTAEMGTLGKYKIGRCVSQEAMACEKVKEHLCQTQLKKDSGLVFRPAWCFDETPI